MPCRPGFGADTSESYLLTLAAFALALWCEVALNRAAGAVYISGIRAGSGSQRMVGRPAPALLVVGLSVVASRLLPAGPWHAISLRHRPPRRLRSCGSRAGWSVVAVLAGAVSRQVDRERDGEACRRAGRSRRRIVSHRQRPRSARHERRPRRSKARVQEPLHWLGADAGVFFVFSEDEKHITVARAVGYTLTSVRSWDLDAFGDHSPICRIHCSGSLRSSSNRPRLESLSTPSGRPRVPGAITKPA